MTKPKQTWQKKWLAKEEGSSSGDSSTEVVGKVTPVRGKDNLRSGDGNTELGNRNPNSGNINLGKENDRQLEEPVLIDVSMVFMIPAKFCEPMEDIAELVLGEECAMLEKPEHPGAHMRPLFIRGHLDGTPIGHMLVDVVASVNILPLSLFKKLGHVEGDLKRTNLTISGFAGDLTEQKE
jgi:hypothetical protein